MQGNAKMGNVACGETSKRETVTFGLVLVLCNSLCVYMLQTVANSSSGARKCSEREKSKAKATLQKYKV